MVQFRRADHDQVNAFEITRTYLFKHYFEGEEVFTRLKPYYNGHQYRFEVPSTEFDRLSSFLADHGYELLAVEALEEFVVAVEQYTAHPENIFKASVIQRSADGYNYFLMTDQTAVDRAEREGARRLTDTSLANPFE